MTVVCPGGIPSGTIPTERPGKTITNAITLSVDANGDGIPESVLALTQVTVLNRNLVRATLLPLTTAPGTAFPLIAQGGVGTLTTTTTFTSGDNNVFGPFTRTTVGSLGLGTRAPVVVGFTAVQGTCGLPQDVLISGFGFVNLSSSAPAITKVEAIQEDNPGVIIPATTFNVLDNNLIAARFNLGTANAGKQFRIFVTGPGGTSRNLFTLPTAHLRAFHSVTSRATSLSSLAAARLEARLASAQPVSVSVKALQWRQSPPLVRVRPIA